MLEELENFWMASLNVVRMFITPGRRCCWFEGVEEDAKSTRSMELQTLRWKCKAKGPGEMFLCDAGGSAVKSIKIWHIVHSINK